MISQFLEIPDEVLCVAEEIAATEIGPASDDLEDEVDTFGSTDDDTDVGMVGDSDMGATDDLYDMAIGLFGHAAAKDDSQRESDPYHPINQTANPPTMHPSVQPSKQSTD